MFDCWKKKKKRNTMKDQEPKYIPPWHLLAQGEVGVKEIPGSKDNPRIVEYGKAVTLNISDDETPWCSSFVCWCLETSGVRSTRSAAARSHLQWGSNIHLNDAKPGDVVIFQRGNSSWQGHVGFFVKREGTYIHVLGGNQSDQVCIKPYSISKLLGIRRAIINETVII